MVIKALGEDSSIRDYLTRLLGERMMSPMGTLLRSFPIPGIFVIIDTMRMLQKHGAISLGCTTGSNLKRFP